VVCDNGGVLEGGLGMADRKQFQNIPVVDQELARLLNESRNRPVTEEELREQRVSFAFGNAPAASDRITKDSVRAAATHIKML
jgi:hypothetical protein